MAGQIEKKIGPVKERMLRVDLAVEVPRVVGKDFVAESKRPDTRGCDSPGVGAGRVDRQGSSVVGGRRQCTQVADEISDLVEVVPRRQGEIKVRVVESIDCCLD